MGHSFSSSTLTTADNTIFSSITGCISLPLAKLNIQFLRLSDVEDFFGLLHLTYVQLYIDLLNSELWYR